MANKLKDVFNKEPIELLGNINFESHEASENFHKALEVVFNEGKLVKVDGVKNIDMNVQDDKRKYPLSIDRESYSAVIVAPEKENILFEVDTQIGKRKINLERYQTKTQVIIETSIKSIVCFKFVYNKGLQTSLINYKSQIQNAKTIAEIVESFEVGVSFIEHMLSPNKIKEAESIYEFIEMMKYKKADFIRLSEIEKVFRTKFELSELEKAEDAFEDINELYYLIVKGYVVKSSRKYTDLETYQVNINEENKDFTVGKTIVFTTTAKEEYNLLNQKISISLSVVILNAVIQEVISDGENTYKVTYTDTDAKPLVIAYSGYITEKEAEIESGVAIKNIEKYTAAKTIEEYWKAEIKNIE